VKRWIEKLLGLLNGSLNGALPMAAAADEVREFQGESMSRDLQFYTRMDEIERGLDEGIATCTAIEAEMSKRFPKPERFAPLAAQIDMISEDLEEGE
jgi:hypothetical protein